MRTFGASAPLRELPQEFGFTAERLIATARQVLAAAR
jgi:transketolase